MKTKQKNKEKKDNILKQWYRLAEPNKTTWFFQCFFYICNTIFVSLLTIFAAKTINSLYESDWTMAYVYLACELATIIVNVIFMHFQYSMYTKTYSSVRMNVTKKIYNKIVSCDSVKMNKVSKEKVLNIAMNNMSSLSEFPDVIAKVLAFGAQVLITLVVVFVKNYLAGIIVFAMGILNFFAYYYFNKKLGKLMLARNETRDTLMQSYSKVIDGQAVINEFSGREKYESEIVEKAGAFNKAYSKYYKIASYKVNIYYAVWNAIAYAITALMIFFVSKGTLDLTAYLIIVPYISSCTEKLNSLFDKTNELENMRVDVGRVNIILSLSDRQLVKYGKINVETNGYNLGLIDVNYNNSDPLSDNCGTLKNIDISFKMGGINIVKGEKQSGKRLIFNLLRRQIKPDSGSILYDNLNLYDYNEKTFKNHIYYCASHPIFIKGTIKENLLLVEKNFDKVKEVCANVGVLEEIEKMPYGFETSISDVTSSGIRFLIGFARALLSKCKVLMVYEIPQDMPNSFRTRVKKVLSKYNTNKTVILFTHTNVYDSIADLCYEVKDGKVKAVSLGKTTAKTKKEKTQK